MINVSIFYITLVKTLIFLFNIILELYSSLNGVVKQIERTKPYCMFSDKNCLKLVSIGFSNMFLSYLIL